MFQRLIDGAPDRKSPVRKKAMQKDAINSAASVRGEQP
jgi:hypothetical protein